MTQEQIRMLEQIEVALDNGIEYAKECLLSHDRDLGRTTLQNKNQAERIEKDISHIIECQSKLNSLLRSHNETPHFNPTETEKITKRILAFDEAFQTKLDAMTDDELIQSMKKAGFRFLPYTTSDNSDSWEVRNRLFMATEDLNDTYRDWLHGIAEDCEMRSELDRLEAIIQEVRRDPKLSRRNHQ